ncbi:uncharacterized protein LOC116774471 [Danaus plexippus]|nr:uncharacterized protein LOC116774471 [Danaus plexippus]XP_061380915.1 uncharacterized protein LOC116774471 [Danaus plexippus]
MMSPLAKALCCMIFLSLVCKSFSIHCYYCNSANNTACLDVKQYDDEVRSRIIPIVHCESAIPSPVAMNFFCRKIVQTIYHTYRESEVRVTRGCGWVPHHKECYKDDNSDHLGTVCQCFQDLCNSGDTVDPTTATTLFIAFSICLYFLR